jgi:hypothetical protein
MKILFFWCLFDFLAYTTGPVCLKIPKKLQGASLKPSKQFPSLHEDDPTTT